MTGGMAVSIARAPKRVGGVHYMDPNPHKDDRYKGDLTLPILNENN